MAPDIIIVMPLLVVTELKLHVHDHSFICVSILINWPEKRLINFLIPSLFVSKFSDS